MKNLSLQNKPLNSLLFAARITGIFWIIICLVILIGYSIESYWQTGLLIPYNIISIFTVAWLIAGLYGLVIALWYEGIGIVVSFMGFSLFILFLIIEPKLTFSPFSLVIYLPTILYFAYWFEARKQPH